MSATERPIGIYYEHPDWFRPLFNELDRRGTTYVKLDATRHRYDPTSDEDKDLGLVFNRMSPSAYLREHGHSILYTLHYLAHLEQLGVRVVNGVQAFRVETSKALQLSLLKSLELPFPPARVINHPAEAPAAARGLRFPVVVKANIGGSGAGIVRFDQPDHLVRAAAEGRISLGLDQTALVQEFIPARGGHITRVEILGGRYLYAINVYSTGESFNLCPADICQSADGVTLNRPGCAADAPRNNIRVEAATPPGEAITDVERIMRAAGIEIGGVEYIVDDRDGQRYYYDINALSNFVADAPRIVGFDPVPLLADYLEQELERSRPDRDSIVPAEGIDPLAASAALPAGLSEGVNSW